MRLALLIFVLSFCLAGCAEPAGEYSLGGVFSTSRTNDDLADFQATVEPYTDGPVALMESWPEQFFIGELTHLDCVELRGKLLTKNYLHSVRECTGPS